MFTPDDSRQFSSFGVTIQFSSLIPPKRNLMQTTCLKANRITAIIDSMKAICRSRAQVAADENSGEGRLNPPAPSIVVARLCKNGKYHFTFPNYEFGQM